MHRRAGYFCVLVGLAILLSAACAAGGGEAIREAPCEPFAAAEFTAAVAGARDSIDAVMADGEMPGLAVAAVVQGQLVWSEGFGVADVQSSEPVCRPTMFRLGSVSKVLTGAALLRLADAGTLSLDTDVRTLLEGVRDKPHPISMRHLAGHLGGIRHYGAGEYFNTRRFSSVEEGLEIFVSDTLMAPPGAEYRYSSYGYNLLGAAMAAAAGVPYLDLVEETVLEPLGLHDIHAESTVENAPALAKHYSGTRGAFTDAGPFDSSDRWPSGGWVGSAEDVARLGSGLLDPDFLSPGSQRLLRSSQRTLSGEETGMSIGVRIESSDGGLVLHHGGTSVGARAFLLIRPETHVVVAMLANGDATFDQEQILGIARLFNDVNPECLSMSTEQAIASVRQAYMDAFNGGDADGVADLHTESSIQMPAGMASVTGRESIRDLMQTSLSGMPEGARFEFESLDLRVADGWAVERGVTPAVPPFPAGKYVMLYEREADGCWRIAWTITNSDR